MQTRHFYKICCIVAVLMMIALPTESLAKSSKRNLITKINAKEKSVTVNGKVYVMRAGAKITYKGKKAKFSDLKVGMRVTMSSRVKAFRGFTENKKAKENIYEFNALRANDYTPREKKKKR